MVFKEEKTHLAQRAMLQLNVPTHTSRSVTRTLRLDEDVENGIVEIARKEKLPFNLLANKALRKLVEWESKAEKFGFVNFPAATLEKLFSTLSEEQARELGRAAGTNMIPEMIFFWYKKFDVVTALKAIKLVASYGKPFMLEHTIDGRSDIVVLKHDHGPRVSAYYAELLRTMFESLGSSVNTEETDGQVLATIIRPLASPIER
jgi:hypothetical protein